MAVRAESVIQGTAEGTLRRATGHLLSLQHERGWWKGELETNVTMDAEDLLLREFMGIRGSEETRLAANWIRSKQRDDGTWANFFGGPAELSTTAEAYVALRLAGDPPGAAHMRRAAEYVLESGGLERTRVFTHMWLALFGLWSWDDIPALPPEVIFLPEWFPLNVYDFACWARQTIVALTVVGAHRPVRSLPFGLDELRTGSPKPPPDPLSTWRGRFQRLDRALHRYERHPSRRLRRLALARATEWILRRQEADGGWGGIQPPWVYSLIALHLMGYPLNHPDIDDTAEVVLALRRVAHPDRLQLEAAAGRGVEWTLGMQSSDGGWGAFDADNTRDLCRRLPFCDFGEVIDPPSADVTAHVLEMLATEGLAGQRAARRGLGWLARNQEREGSWFGRWGANHVYGTGAAVPAAIAAGIPKEDPKIR